MKYKLRPYQQECISKMTETKMKKNGIRLPTASGKTIIFSEYVKRNPDKNFLIIVHRDELVDQTKSKLYDYNLKYNVEKAESKSNDEEIKQINLKIAERKIKYKNQLTNSIKSFRGMKDKIEFLQVVYDQIKQDWEKFETTKLVKGKIKTVPITEIDQLDVPYKDLLRLNRMPTAYAIYLYKKYNITTREELKTLTKSINVEYIGSERQSFLENNISVNTTTKLSRGVGQVFDNNIYRALKSGGSLDMLKRRIEQNTKKHNSIGKKTIEKASIVIASVQSLHDKRLKLWDVNAFDHIIFDEAHHLQADSWKRIDKYFDTKSNFGFSATLQPFKINYHKLYSKQIPELISAGYLASPQHTIVEPEDYAYKDVRVGSLEHSDMIIKTILNHKRDKIIVFTNSVEQSDEICLKLRSMNRNAESISCETNEKKRKNIIKNFKAGNLKIICNYQIINEGFDDPGSTVIIPRATLDIDVYTQIAGRGLRITDKKKKVKIIDIVIKKDQCALPVLFGMHPRWAFENEPIKDYLKAKAFADQHELKLSQYPNWGFLKLKKPITDFVRERRPNTDYKNVLGNNIKITKYGKRYAKGVGFGGSNFYNPQTCLTKEINEKIKYELNCGVVKDVTPSATIGDDQLQGIDQKRSVVAIGLRKYIKEFGRLPRFLNSIYMASKQYPLSEKQCDAAMKVLKQFRDAIKEQDMLHASANA